MPKISSFNVTYDHSSDVLYISKRREPAIHGVEDRYGTVWRYAGDGELIGVTIVDFRDVWADRGTQLANDLARGFDIPVQQALVVLEHATDQEE